MNNKRYDVMVTRESVDSEKFTVFAADPELAREKAIEFAGDHEFGSGNAEYSAQIIREENCSLEEKATEKTIYPQNEDGKLNTVILVDNVMKVLDVDANSLSEETKQELNHRGPAYQDLLLKEHLYDEEKVDPQYNEDELPLTVSNELKALFRLLSENDCGYLRLIFP